MRHMPFFRWVLTLGLVLIGCSWGLYLAAPGYPELRQIELTVLVERPDGDCTVRWTDPFDHREREGPYLCDPERSEVLKAPYYDPDADLGWESGFVIAEGPDKGKLYSLRENDDGTTDWRIELSDTLVGFGLLLTVIGLVGGNVRALSRAVGVSPGVIRRARLLEGAAAAVAHDHRQAVEAVRRAWAPLHRELVDAELGRMPVGRLRGATRERLSTEEVAKSDVQTVRDVLDARTWGLRQHGVERRTAEVAVAAARRIADEVGEAVRVRVDADRPEPRTTALLVALRVLVEAGPQARNAAEAGRELAARLEPLLTDATPASGLKHMLAAGPEQRRRARAAVAELRLLVGEAQREGVARQFAQASVDLLRGPDSDPAGLSAWVDFEARPAEYYGLLADVTGHSLSSADRSEAR